MAKQGLKNIAYDYLVEGILSYKILPGTVIVEQEISDLLGISRTPVREALKMLEADGLVNHVASRGTFVKFFTPQDVSEIFEIRTILEVAALKNAINLITDEEIDTLEEQLNALEDDSNQEAFYKSDRELHRLILNYSKNSRMVSLHDTMSFQLERLRRISSMTPRRLQASKQEHLDIVRAIKAREYEQAKTLLEYHIKNVKKSTIAVCENLQMQLSTKQMI